MSSLTTKHLKYAIPAAAFLMNALTAQTIIEDANESLNQEDPIWAFQEGEEAPMLLEEEFEDVGPQYLLTPGSAAHEWFRAILDLQWFNSTNPTFTDDNSQESADVMVATAQIAAVSPEYAVLEGSAEIQGGYRYQLFEYGNLSGDEIINGQPVSQNDFRAHTLFVDSKWEKDDWRVTGGLRYTQLDNSLSGHDFYNEFVLSWGLARNFSLSSDALLTLSYHGSAFFTESETGAVFFRDDFNDRVSNGLNARLTYRVNSKLFIQPNARLTYSDYSSDPNGDREDTITSIGCTLSYYVKPDIVIRLFANYRNRDTNGVGIADYSNLDTGLGGNFSFKF